MRTVAKRLDDGGKERGDRRQRAVGSEVDYAAYVDLVKGVVSQCYSGNLKHNWLYSLSSPRTQL